MPVNIPRLVYFEAFMNPIAVTMLSGRDDLELVRLEYAAPADENLTEMQRAHAIKFNRAPNCGSHGSATRPCWRTVRTSSRSAPPAPATT